MCGKCSKTKMAGEPGHWWPCKLKYLEANYERCKLKVRQDSLYCKLFILEYQNRLEEEKRITLKYENKAVYQRLQQAEQKHLDLTNEKEFVSKKAVEDLTNVEGEWRAKTDKLIKNIESLQEEKENEIRSKDNYILQLTGELEDLKRLSRSKETHAAGNGDEQPRKLDRTKKTEVLREQNYQKTTTSNAFEAQCPDDIVHAKTKTVSERRNGNCDIAETNMIPDNSEISKSSSGGKFLESEVGCVLEVTEEMLKSCRRRSVLKRKKSEVCDLVLENDDTYSVELSECTKQDKTRRERRVTFNGELEFKLPDGSKEVAELAIDDSSGQLESQDDQNGREDDLEVFDDVLSRETHVRREGLDTGCNVLEEKDGRDVEEMSGTKNLKGENENEVKNETESCDVHEQFLENTQMNDCLDRNLAKGKRNTGKKGNKIVIQQGIMQQNGKMTVHTENIEENDQNIGDNDQNIGDMEKDKVKKMKGNENRRFSVEADILLTADRQSGYEDIGESKRNIKTPKTDDEIQVNSKNSNSDEAAHAQLGETGGRKGKSGPRRGLRQEVSGSKNVKSSKRLLDVFCDEVKSNEVEKKEKSLRNRKGNKKKTSNAVARNTLVDAPVSNSETENDAESLEKEKEEAALENEVASDNENKPRTRKTQNKKASRKTNKTKIENEEEESVRKQRGKRKREKTSQELLVSENECKDAEVEEQGRDGNEVQDCSPIHSSEVESSGNSKSVRVKHDTEEEKIVDKNCEEVEVNDDFKQEQNMVNEEDDKEDDGLLIEKKNAGRRRRRRKTQKKEDPNISYEMRKRKLSEPEIDEENNDDGKQDTERINVHIETDDTNGISLLEEREQDGNESERTEAEVNNVAENKQKKTTLRSKKRKSPEPEIDENKNNDIQDWNENNKQGIGNETKERVLDEVNERKTTLRSKKIKSPEPEIGENKNNDIQGWNENNEQTEQGIGNESKETKERVLDEVNERKTTLRSKKRKSPEPEIDKKSDTQDMNENNEDKKTEQGIGSESKETKERVLDEANERKTTLRSKKIEAPEPAIYEIVDLTESKEVEFEDAECNESLPGNENVNEVVSNNKRSPGKTRGKRKSETVVVNSARKSKNGKKKEVDDVNKNEGVEDEDQEIKVREFDDEKKENNNKKTSKRGRKRLAVEEHKMKAVNEKKMESGVVTRWMDDENKQNNDKKTNKRGRKRLAVEEHEIKAVNGNEKMESGVVTRWMNDETKENNDTKTSKRGRKRLAVEKEENKMKAVMSVNEDVTGVMDNENKGNCERNTRKKGRKRELTGENDMKGKRSEKEGSTMKINEEEIKDKRQSPGKLDKQEKTTQRKRRTLYSIRENTTFFNATSSIFQETLPINQTRNSSGMPPSLSTFMKAFIVPKLKKK